MQDVLGAAVDAAKLAGAHLLRAQEDMLSGKDIGVREKTSHIDLVSKADQETQDLMTEFLHARFPAHRFLCEEPMDDIGDPLSPYRWVIDPLDGTTCFLHGKENFGTILALQKNEKTVLGVMLLPKRDELLVCVRGKGVMRNGKPLTKLRETKGMKDAVLCTNILHRAIEGRDGLSRITVPDCASLQNYGSAAEEMAEIVLQRNDGAFFDGIRLWDIAAGALMVEELGGNARMEFEDPNDHRSGLLAVISTKPIFEDLSGLVFTKKITKH